MNILVYGDSIEEIKVLCNKLSRNTSKTIVLYVDELFDSQYTGKDAYRIINAINNGGYYVIGIFKNSIGFCDIKNALIKDGYITEVIRIDGKIMPEPNEILASMHLIDPCM